MRATVVIAAIGVLVSSTACQKIKAHPITPSDAPLSSVQKTSELPSVGSGHCSGQSTGFTPYGQVEGMSGFELYGTCDTETGAVHMSTPEAAKQSITVYAEADVKEGKVRVYLGPKVEQAIVTDSDLAKAGYSYADATPGHPVKIKGEMITRGGYNGVILEAVEPVKGLTWRVWN